MFSRGAFARPISTLQSQLDARVTSPSRASFLHVSMPWWNSVSRINPSPETLMYLCIHLPVPVVAWPSMIIVGTKFATLVITVSTPHCRQGWRPTKQPRPGGADAAGHESCSTSADGRSNGGVPAAACAGESSLMRNP